jgi:TrwC relaxase
VTRTGYHGVRMDGQEPGRFEAAGLIVTSWLQGTSRDGDPQDHVHNQIARITRTFSDGKWRAHDTASLRAVLGALQPHGLDPVRRRRAAVRRHPGSGKHRQRAAPVPAHPVG